MRARFLFSALALFLAAALVVPEPADAQLRRLRRAAENAVEGEMARQVDRLLREAIRCAIDDPACDAQARGGGGEEDVIYTDANGEVIVDDDGVPITDRQQAADRAGVDLDDEAAAESGPAAVRPGEGVWANYDFVPGDRVLFYEDFASDRVGDFPRRLEFVEGNMEVVEWEGGRYLRATAYSKLRVPLPEVLPERFTLEFDYHQPAGHQQSRFFTSDHEGHVNQYEGSYLQLGNQNGMNGNGPTSLTNSYRTREEMTPIRVQVDGGYVKVYLGEERVANLPNANVIREDALYFELNGNQNNPAYLGNLRVASGGLDMYDRLEAEGRVTTRGIYFAVDSDQIRPESTGTLREIGTMLEQHADLRIRIEGHTDGDGDETYNQELSERRAASVAGYLVETFGIDASRLETAGLGESRPVAENDTSEGKQKNRRVELVRLDG